MFLKVEPAGNHGREASARWEACRISIRIAGVESVNRGRYLAVAAFVAMFVVLYPYLGLVGYCDDGGCPEVTQISASAAPDLPANSILTTRVAPVAATLGVLALLLLVQRRPDEVLLSPESPPPRS